MNPSTITLCWRCNCAYAITAPACPNCGAANANVNPDAVKESQDE